MLHLPYCLPKSQPPQANASEYLICEKYDGVRGYWDGEKLCFRIGGKFMHLRGQGKYQSMLGALRVCKGEEGQYW